VLFLPFVADPVRSNKGNDGIGELARRRLST
jgi:hypothetical protein